MSCQGLSASSARGASQPRAMQSVPVDHLQAPEPECTRAEQRRISSEESNGCVESELWRQAAKGMPRCSFSAVSTQTGSFFWKDLPGAAEGRLTTEAAGASATCLRKRRCCSAPLWELPGSQQRADILLKTDASAGKACSSRGGACGLALSALQANSVPYDIIMSEV